MIFLVALSLKCGATYLLTTVSVYLYGCLLWLFEYYQHWMIIAKKFQISKIFVIFRKLNNQNVFQRVFSNVLSYFTLKIVKC